MCSILSLQPKFIEAIGLCIYFFFFFFVMKNFSNYRTRFVIYYINIRRNVENVKNERNFELDRQERGIYMELSQFLFFGRRYIEGTHGLCPR